MSESYRDKVRRAKKQQEKKEKDINMQNESTTEESKNSTPTPVQNITEADLEDNSPAPQRQPTQEEIIVSIVGQKALTELANMGITLAQTNQIQSIVEKANQQNRETEIAKSKLEIASDRVKELRGITKKFYQMEAITLACKEALQAMLKSFETQGPQGAHGWPTLQVFTPDGWIKGSVDYTLYNAVLLAKAATTSEHLKVVEKHVRGFTDQIQMLAQDVSDLQSFIQFKVDKCSHCNRFKKVNSKCHHCGKSESDGLDFLEDDQE